MKTKHSFLAALTTICAMTMTIVFTACGSDDDNNDTPNSEDTTPKKVMMNFTYYATEDMLTYCDVQVTVGNKTEAMTMTNTTKESIKGVEYYAWKQTVSANELPANFTFSRKVTLKQNIDDVAVFTFTRGYAYNYALYNAADKKVKDGQPYKNIGTESGPGANVAALINEGRLDNTSTFAFDKDGNEEMIK